MCRYASPRLFFTVSLLQDLADECTALLRLRRNSVEPTVLLRRLRETQRPSPPKARRGPELCLPNQRRRRGRTGPASHPRQRETRPQDLGTPPPRNRRRTKWRPSPGARRAQRLEEGFQSQKSSSPVFTKGKHEFCLGRLPGRWGDEDRDFVAVFVRYVSRRGSQGRGVRVVRRRTAGRRPRRSCSLL